MVEKYYSDPIEFVKATFNATPTSQQEQVLAAIAKDKKVSVRAGHGVGKSTLASWAVYWFLLTRPYPKIICTAPTFHQLYDVLWAELAKWRRQSTLVTECFDWLTRRIEAKWAPEDWWAAARTASKAEGLQGRHADNFMLIVDEASGLDDEIFEASEGMLTGPNTYVLMIGNPTRSQGYFFDTFNDPELKDIWSLHELSCYGSLIGDGGLVTQDYIDGIAARYGRDSNVFRVRVLGEFPADDKDSLIPRSWVEAAVNRDCIIRDERRIMGVDVGAGGDLSAIVIRQGDQVTFIETANYKNTMDVVAWVLRLAKEHDVYAICIDPIGIGKGGYDRLVELGANVFDVDVRRKSYSERARLMRDELWWRVRDQFEKGTISIPDDRDLVMELSSIKYKVGNINDIKVQSKAEMRKSHTGGGIGHSPDKADALALTYYLDEEALDFAEEDEDLFKPQKSTMELGRNAWTGY